MRLPMAVMRKTVEWQFVGWARPTKWVQHAAARAIDSLHRHRINGLAPGFGGPPPPYSAGAVQVKAGIVQPLAGEQLMGIGIAVVLACLI